MANALNNPPENIDWIAIKNALFSGATQAIGHIPKGRHKISVTPKWWKRIDNKKELNALLIGASSRKVRQLGYCVKKKLLLR